MSVEGLPAFFSTYVRKKDTLPRCGHFLAVKILFERVTPSRIFRIVDWKGNNLGFPDLAHRLAGEGSSIERVDLHQPR